MHSFGRGPPRGQNAEDEFQPMRRFGQRPLDPFCSLINEREQRAYGAPRLVVTQPHEYHSKDVVCAMGMRQLPLSAAAPKWVHTLYNNKRAGAKRMFLSMCFTPDGRRFITGNDGGEFILWHGTSLASEMKSTGHDNLSIRSAVWSEAADVMLSSGDDGRVMYWGRNMNNLKSVDIQLGNIIRTVTAAPSGRKFACGTFSGYVTFADFETGTVERSLEGHTGEVFSTHWHPQKNLLISGAKSLTAGQVLLWDPRCQIQQARIEGHSDNVTCTRWSPHQDFWFLTASADHTIKLWDLRKLEEMYTFKGHKANVNSVSWHPVHHGMFASGGADGSICHWLVGRPLVQSEGNTTLVAPATVVHKSHGEGMRKEPHPVMHVEWHPLGQMLASTHKECKLWTHNKPGGVEDVRDPSHIFEATNVADLRAKAKQWNKYVAPEKEKTTAAVRISERPGWREESSRRQVEASEEKSRPRDDDLPKASQPDNAPGGAPPAAPPAAPPMAPPVAPPIPSAAPPAAPVLQPPQPPSSSFAGAPIGLRMGGLPMSHERHHVYPGMPPSLPPSLPMSSATPPAYAHQPSRPNQPPPAYAALPPSSAPPTAPGSAKPTAPTSPAPSPAKEPEPEPEPEAEAEDEEEVLMEF